MEEGLRLNVNGSHPITLQAPALLGYRRKVLANQDLKNEHVI